MASKEVITSANWRIHPNNQWSFQNIEKLFATEVIKKSEKKPSVFSSNLSKIDAIEFVTLEEKKQTVKEMLKNGYADSFLVLKKGEIIFEEYFNGMSQESLHLLNSISKNFTGMLTGVIVKLGCHYSLRCNWRRLFNRSNSNCNGICHVSHRRKFSNIYSGL